MKFLLYGESEAVGSGAWCYAEALLQLGHEVVTFSPEYHLQSYNTTSILRLFRRTTHRVLRAHRLRHVQALIDMAREQRPEIVIILKGLCLDCRDIRNLKTTGAWVVNINHDDFFSHNRNNWSWLQRSAIPAYDYIFTTREVNVREIYRLNPHVEFFPFAYCPQIHRPVALTKSEVSQWTTDVLFVGTWEKYRCRQLEYLVRRVPARYSIWGSQWEKVSFSSPLQPFLRKRPIVMAEMAKAIGGAKISLAFLRKENRDDYTQRTFEIPACGGVLLAERTARHLDFYQEGVEAEFFDANSNDDLVSKALFLLKNDVHREKLRGAGRAALLRQQHTYEDRVARLIELYSLRCRVTVNPKIDTTKVG